MMAYTNYAQWLEKKAAELRQTPTPSEGRMIDFFKKNKIKYHFQVPILISEKKGYIADFVLFGKVILEIDGQTHTTPEAKERDKQRTEDLEKKGYTVIRMRNSSTSAENIYRVMLDRLDKIMPATAARIRKEFVKKIKSDYWKKCNREKPDWNWRERVWNLSGGHYPSY